MKKIENIVGIISTLFLVWILASWIDMVSDMGDMTRNYEWWNIVHLWNKLVR